MLGLSGGGRTALRGAAFLVSAALLAPAASAQEDLIGSYVVDLAEVERLNGGIEAKTFRCPMAGSCVAVVRVEIRGETYDYFVFAKTTAAMATVRFSGRDRAAPDLMTGSADQIEVQRAPDGTGSRDAALTALAGSSWYTTKPHTLRVPLPPRLPLANVRVTVRREDVVERNR